MTSPLAAVKIVKVKFFTTDQALTPPGFNFQTNWKPPRDKDKSARITLEEFNGRRDLRPFIHELLAHGLIPSHVFVVPETEERITTYMTRILFRPYNSRKTDHYLAKCSGALDFLVDGLTWVSSATFDPTPEENALRIRCTEPEGAVVHRAD